MDTDHSNSDSVQPLKGDIQQPQAISLDKADEIASEVQELVKAGRENSAWELIRNLHPADMGSIVASLPRTSRDAMVRVMSPETVAWMLTPSWPGELGLVSVCRCSLSYLAKSIQIRR